MRQNLAIIYFLLLHKCIKKLKKNNQKNRKYNIMDKNQLLGNFPRNYILCKQLKETRKSNVLLEN